MKSQDTKRWLFTLALGAVGLTQAGEIYWVNINSPVQIPPYTNDWNEAAHSVQQVLEYAQDGDTILVSEGTYTLTSSIVVTNDIDIHGWWLAGDAEVVFDGQGLYTVFDLGDHDCNIGNFTIRNGKDAGVRCSGALPIVSRCIIESTEGSGMVKGRASDCVFSNNTGGYYGGGANSTIATGCTFINNEANQGGGAYKVTATDCTFQNNASTGEGGGLYYGTATNCLFLGNIAGGSGGGLCSSTAIGCAISGNRAGGYGGGLYTSSATQCTITENTASFGGGMAYAQAYNSILWNNTANNSPTVYGTQIYSCCLPDSTANGSITNNPQLLSISHLAATSPCLGAGNATYTAGTDIDGEEWQAAPAIGCDEINVGNVTGTILPYNDLPERVSAGQAIYFNAYIDGSVTQTILDFGDGTSLTNSPSLAYSHAWTYGNYAVVLTGYNDNHPSGISITNIVYAREDTGHTIYVSDADGSDNNDGASWATAKKTIQAGVDAQEWTGGLVLVSNGTYSVTVEIIVEKDLRIQSVNGAENTTVMGNANQRLFYLSNHHTTLSGFTLTNGGPYGTGANGAGAVQCTSTSPIVTDCILTGNTGSGGGAMWRGTANNCTFSKNTGGNGPGGMKDGIANDCLFINNVSGNIGAGGMNGGIANRCIFKENQSPVGGGAQSTIANDCQFIQNLSTSLGGGMYNGTANNCVFNQNKAYQGGGATYGTKATHCTITANQAGTSGGGMYGGTAENCIIWHNTALVSANDLTSTTASTSCSPDLTHGTSGNITNNPQLVSASHIALTSPCAGSGTIPRDSLDIDGEHWRSTPAMGCDEPSDSPIGDLTITIDGPSDVPAGFETFFDVDIQGQLSDDYIDFGDGETALHAGIIPIWHTWSAPGTYDMVITAYNADHPAGYSVTKTITVFAADFNTIYVSPSGSDENNGRSWDTAKLTIQAAIDEQELPGGRVMVADGTYTLTATIKIDKDIQLLSQNGAETTIIDAINLKTIDYQHSRAMEIGDNHSLITGLTIRNANFSWTGGGIFCDYTFSPIVSNCIIADNHAGTAGGMCYGTAIDCVFSNNTASTGAGLYLSHASRCEFIANTASGSGGGMYGGTADDCIFIENRIYTTGSNYGNGAGMSKGIANNCTFTRNDSNGYGGGINEGTANDCLFIENTAIHGGGGIRNSVANRCSFFGNSAITYGGAIHNSTVTRCVVSGNRAETGGGMYYGNAYSCSFSGNKAYGVGGGTHSAKLFNCTVTGNTANEVGGVQGQPINCIVWGNSAATGKNDINDGNISLNYIVNTCSPDAPHGTDGSITNNPLLISGSCISAASPCIGAGDAAYASGTDLDGEAWGNPPAMGCDEVGATLSGPVEMALYGPSPIRTSTAGNYIASFSGSVSKTIVDFGHGIPLTNSIGVIHHTWPGPAAQNYTVILTAFNDDYPLGTSYTQTVEVVDSTSDIYVRKFDGDNTNDGSSWTSAKPSVQAGIDAQNVYNGKVWVDGATYPLFSPITINKSIHLIGTDSGDIHGGGNIAIVDAGGTDRCFDVGDVACTIENFTLQNGAASTLGYSNNEGGGIRCKTINPVLRLVTIMDSTAYYGGAVYKGTLESCTLSNNTATSYGGAIYESVVRDSIFTGNSASNYGGGAANAVLLANCTLTFNTAKTGGAVYNSTLTNCTLMANTASSSGGAGYSSTLYASTITSNTAPQGGGLHACTAYWCDISTNNASVDYGGGMYYGTAYDCTLHFNRAEKKGGGTYSTGLYNCTVADNMAFDTGGAYAGTIRNSILWNNFALSNAANISSATPYYSCYPEADPSNTYYGNITNAPLFVAHAPDFLLRGSDYYLSPISPCINAGNNSYVQTSRDFNGWSRILHGTVEMGANEGWISDGDYDDDGLDDGWELENFGGVTNAVADAHSDSDIFNNLDEYIAGTDPFDPLDYFHITGQEMTNDSVIIHWEAKQGRAYDVAWAETLTNDYNFIGFNLYYPIDHFADTNHSDSATGFYKIRVKN
jgi:hypothetical protein